MLTIINNVLFGTKTLDLRYNDVCSSLCKVVEALVKTCSILLEDRNLESWREMGNDKKKRKALTKLTRVLENAGLLLPEGARENQEVTISAKNICKYCGSIRVLAASTTLIIYVRHASIASQG